MKSIFSFVCIAFLCLACGKRAPLNLSLPPAEYKAEQNSQATSAVQSNQRLIGIESGLLRFDSLQGGKTLQLKGACPVKHLSKEALLFSCLNFSEQEELAQASQLTLKEIDFKPLLNIPDSWETQIETFFYWPENKRIIPVAEFEFRQGKVEVKNIFQGEKFSSNFYLIVRLKKSVTLNDKKILTTWNNDEALELSSFDFEWQKKEDTKVVSSLEFSREYLVSNPKIGTVLEFTLAVSKKMPRFELRSSNVGVLLVVDPNPRARTQAGGRCTLVERIVQGVQEESLKLGEAYSTLNFRLHVAGKQYTLSELIAWGKATLVFDSSAMKIRLFIEDIEWEKGIRLLVLPSAKQKMTTGFMSYENCRSSNANVVGPVSIPSSTVTEYQIEEVYKGTMTIKESF